MEFPIILAIVYCKYPRGAVDGIGIDKVVSSSLGIFYDD
jgi:hypothetical protein